MADAPEHLQVCVEQRGDPYRVALRGELDLAAVDFVVEALCELAGASVVLNLASLSFLDVAGLGALLEAKHRFERQGQQLDVVNARGVTATVIELTGTADYLLTG